MTTDEQLTTGQDREIDRQDKIGRATIQQIVSEVRGKDSPAERRRVTGLLASFGIQEIIARRTAERRNREEALKQIESQATDRKITDLIRS